MLASAQRAPPGPQPAQAAVLNPPASPGIAGSLGQWIGLARDDRHSRRVALLKRLLPAVGIAVLLLVGTWPQLVPLWDRLRLAFPAIDLRDARELQMLNPRYSGVDRVGRPFVVTAASGRQIPDKQDLMSLMAPRADVKTQGGADVAVTAVTGVYQAQTQLLDLFGDVTVVHQNGTRFLTQSARVDAAANTAQGGDPVAGLGPSGSVKAQGFRILDRGDTVLFTGQSEMVLKSAKPATVKSAPPARLPAPVAAAAAQAEAEAKPLLRGSSAAPPAARRPAKPAAAKPAAQTNPAAAKKKT